jgi:hypothetical protein
MSPNPYHPQKHKKCDQQMIIGMLSAEQHTKKINTTAWSPTFLKAVSIKAFWKIMLSLRMNHTQPSERVRTWALDLNITDIANIDIQTIKKELRMAQKSLRDIEKNADQLRSEHLRSMLTEAEINGYEKTIERRLKILVRAHEQKQHYRRLQQIFKPSKSGGLSYILVPEQFSPEDFPYDPDTIYSWELIHDPEKLQNVIQQRNITHFGQAHGTPFTTPPLDKISWQANSKEAREILNGSIPVSFLTNNPHVNKVIQYMADRPNLPDIDTYITKDQVANGFKKWRENTSTSPSGCHLGLRRITSYPCTDTDSEDIRNNILQVQTDVINIPIQNGFSPTRWQTVVNAMLEKIPGKPYLHKLRVIHILEADYNLALKQIFGRRLLQNCEQHGAHGNDGHGCPDKAVEMHSRTLKSAEYHLK